MVQRHGSATLTGMCNAMHVSVWCRIVVKVSELITDCLKTLLARIARAEREQIKNM